MGLPVYKCDLHEGVVWPPLVQTELIRCAHCSCARILVCIWVSERAQAARVVPVSERMMLAGAVNIKHTHILKAQLGDAGLWLSTGPHHTLDPSLFSFIPTAFLCNWQLKILFVYIECLLRWKLKDKPFWESLFIYLFFCLAHFSWSKATALEMLCMILWGPLHMGQLT